MGEGSEAFLYAILEAMVELDIVRSSTISKYFTDKEIELYKDSRYEEERLTFPLEFDMIQIEEDHWIGTIDVDTLVSLGKEQLLCYNPETQRPMQKLVRGKTEYWRITLDQNAVESIADSFRKGKFVPNALTINIPYDSNADFTYDAERKKFIIHSAERLDIIDGYHRYIAACMVKDEDPNFYYSMELRIVNFSTSKAQQFIFQEDQKTKMRKIDSDSYDTSSAANAVVARINENMLCNIQGMIGRNNAPIPQAELAVLIKYFFFNGKRSPAEEKMQIINVAKELVSDFNLITEHNPQYLEIKYTFRTLLSMLYCFQRFADDKKLMCKMVDYTIEQVNASKSPKFFNSTPRKSLIKEVDKIIEEELNV
jgi:hypothetical protein